MLSFVKFVCEREVSVEPPPGSHFEAVFGLAEAPAVAFLAFHGATAEKATSHEATCV